METIMPFLTEWGGTIIFFVVVYSIMLMLDDLLPIRGIFRIIFVIILSLIFKSYGYLIMDRINEMLCLWTDGSLGCPD